jgi:hypothetical protein
MQRIKRILVRLAGMRLSDFKAVVVQGQDVIGVPFDERMPSARLSDGQAVIRLEALRERLRDNPGEVLGEAWELMLQAEEARFVPEQGFAAGVVREFAALFVPRRGHFGEHTEGGLAEAVGS